MRLTFIVPIHNEAPTIKALVEGIRTYSKGHEVQIILVDDGSTDESAAVIREVSDCFDGVEGVYFEDNLGKTEALAKGFSMSKGEVVFTMDGDLQDDPVEIPRFLAKLEEGHDLVCGWKSVRRDPLGRRLMSRLYNAFVGRVFRLSLHDINCGFKAMRLEVARAIDLRYDYHRLIPVLAAARGFRVEEIEVKHHPRRHGKSRYGVERYWKGMRDVGRLWWEIRARR